MSLISTLVNGIDVLIPSARMKRLVTVMIIAMSGIFLGAILVINEISKKDIKQSQLQIEKNRITQIDKQLANIYSIIYTSSDSTNSLGNEKYLDRVKFLKAQRTEAIGNIDNVNNDPNSELFVFTGIASVLIVSLITFFSISFKTDFETSMHEEHSRLSRKSRSLLENYNYGFLSWATTQGILENEDGSLNIPQARVLKSIYDRTKSTDEQTELLKDILKFSQLNRRIDSANSSVPKILIHFKEMKVRLIEECNRLNKQGLINLFICFIVAFLIIGFIAYNSIYSNDIKGINELHVFLIKYLPRLVSILGLITIFLYFIKLYKENLLNVRYYQNELTNIELKLISLHTALERGNEESILALISSYSNTERNNTNSPEIHSFDSKSFNTYTDTAKSLIEKLAELVTSIKGKSESN